MNRFLLSALAAFVATATFAALPLSAQSSARTEIVSSSSAPAAVESAALDLSASSSSSAYNIFASEAKSSAAAAGQVVNRPEGSTRPFSSVGVGFKIGLGGIGFDVATPLIPGRLNLRGGAGFFSYTYTGTINNEPANATLKLNNAEVMVDFFPFKGSFRLSGGTTVYNTTGLNGTTTVAPGSKLTIGNNSYTSAPAPNPLTENLAVGIGGTAVPRFSLGWGNMVPKTGHIRFETELGVEITGTPTSAWTYGGQACQNTAGVTCSTGYASVSSLPNGSADIAAQNASLRSDFNSVKVFPIFSLGLSYKIP